VGLEPWFTMGVSLLRVLHGANNRSSGGLLLKAARGHSQPILVDVRPLSAPVSAIQHAPRLGAQQRLQPVLCLPPPPLGALRSQGKGPSSEIAGRALVAGWRRGSRLCGLNLADTAAFLPLLRCSLWWAAITSRTFCVC
jgi:hypothetical protein